MNLWNITSEAHNFDGHLDPQIFLDWTSDVNYYFDWYNMSDERQI